MYIILNMLMNCTVLECRGGGGVGKKMTGLLQVLAESLFLALWAVGGGFSIRYLTCAGIG